MDPAITAPPFDQLLRAAEDVARERSDVDLELAREVFLEAATLLTTGLPSTGSTTMTPTPSSLGCVSIWWPAIREIRSGVVHARLWRIAAICTIRRLCRGHTSLPQPS